MSAESLTLRQMAAELGEKPRTIQFWADFGVLRPSDESQRKGKGVHRRFDISELRFGRVARKLAMMSSPISEIAEIVERVREIQVEPTREAVEECLNRLEAESRKKANADDFLLLNECLRIANSIGLIAIYQGQIDLFITYQLNGDDVVRDVRFWPAQAHDVANKHARLKDGFVGSKVVRFGIEELRQPEADLENYDGWSRLYTVLSELGFKVIRGIKLKRDLWEEFDSQAASGKIKDLGVLWEDLR